MASLFSGGKAFHPGGAPAGRQGAALPVLKARDASPLVRVGKCGCEPGGELRVFRSAGGPAHSQPQGPAPLFPGLAPCELLQLLRHLHKSLLPRLRHSQAGVSQPGKSQPGARRWVTVPLTPTEWGARPLPAEGERNTRAPPPPFPAP